MGHQPRWQEVPEDKAVWLYSSGTHSGKPSAKDHHGQANKLAGRNALTLGLLGRAYGLSGRTNEARQLLAELEVRRRFGYVPASSIAMIHRGLGELEDAWEWWEKAVHEHDLLLATSLRSEPGYDSLRSHPRYHALRKMNLEA